MPTTDSLAAQLDHLNDGFITIGAVLAAVAFEVNAHEDNGARAEARRSAEGQRPGLNRPIPSSGL
jgi:hypothetical protein